MQTTLIQRYLGNKSPISNVIVELVRSLATPGDLVFDAFSGTLAVSAALRRAGFEVACNDINHFSWTFARAYFSANRLVNSPSGINLDAITTWKSWQERLEALVSEDMSDVPQEARRSDFFDHYCEEGSRSFFKSARGTVGRRRFFSSDNARAIDRALARIRYMSRSGQIDEHVRCVFTAALISAVEKISNTQGTYHDFPREFIDGRALKTISLRMPDPEVFSGLPSRFIGKAEDTLEFVRGLPSHKVMYLDPPYNFRQYTSYYFMLNLLSAYAELDDLDQYFSDIEFVRGQNMKDDFKSTFCSRPDFIPSLTKLIERADTDYVVLSYFDGRNHWGNFKAEEAETEGKRLLEGLFQSDLFMPGSYSFIPVDRLNYQSYGGHSAKPIKEFLFVGRKRKISEVTQNLGESSWTGQDFVLGTA